MTKLLFVILFSTIFLSNFNIQAKANSFISNQCNFDNQKEMLSLVNNYRKENGVGELSLSQELSEVICSHTNWMLSTKNFSHKGKDATNPFQRCKKANTICWAENLAFATDPSTPLFFDLYKNSRSHQKNILNPDYIEIGIADSEIYNGQIFR
jgi:uncharacterized protein YkwD